MKTSKLLIFILIATICFYIMNLIVPFYADDLSYNLPQNDLYSIVQNVIHMYHTLNGRIIPNTLMLSFPTILGENLFNLLNTIIYGCFLYLLLKIDTTNFSKLNAMICIIGIFLIGYRDNLFFWGAGSSNYLWPGTIILLYISLIFKEKHTNNKLYNLLYFVLGIIAGCCHEIFSLPICMMLLYYFITKKESKYNKTFLLLSIGFIIGSIILFSSHGNFSRFNNSTESINSIYIWIIKSLYNILFNAYITIILTITLIIKFIKNRIKTKKFISKNKYYICLWITSFFLPLISISGGRAMFATEIFALILLMKLTQAFINKSLSNKLCIILSVLFIPYFIYINIINSIAWRKYNIYTNTYLNQKTNIVIINDIKQYPLTCSFTLDLEDAFCNIFYVRSLAKFKNSYKEPIEYPIALPKTLFDKISKNELYNPIKTNNLRFYDLSSLYYVLTYNRDIKEKITKGCLYRENTSKLFPSFKVKCNITKEDLNINRPAIVLDLGENRKYILLRKNYKKYWGFNAESWGINSTITNKRFEFSFN